MTYCIGIKTNQGVVLVSDSRTNAGLDNVNIYSKMLTYDVGDRTIIIVTSGNLGTSQAVFKSIEKDIKSSSKVNKIELSMIVAEKLAKKAQDKKITKIFFDRGIYKYHGRVKVFAETLRKNGMDF